jgi:hypothetical protein
MTAVGIPDMLYSIADRVVESTPPETELANTTAIECDSIELVTELSVQSDVTVDDASQQYLADLNAQYYTRSWHIALPAESAVSIDTPAPSSTPAPVELTPVESAPVELTSTPAPVESAPVESASVPVELTSTPAPVELTPAESAPVESAYDQLDIPADNIEPPRYISAAEFDTELADSPEWLVMMIIVYHLDIGGNNIASIFELADTTTNMTIIGAINDPVRRTYDELRSEIEFHADTDICDWINTAHILQAPNVFAMLTNIHQISCRGCCGILIQVALTRPHPYAAMMLMQQFVDDYTGGRVYMPIRTIMAAAAAAFATQEFDDVPVTRDPFSLPANKSRCADICVICQEPCDVASPHDETDPASTTLACSHSFHMPCIRLHYEGTTSKPTCPSCRADIVMA